MARELDEANGRTLRLRPTSPELYQLATRIAVRRITRAQQSHRAPRELHRSHGGRGSDLLPDGDRYDHSGEATKNVWKGSFAMKFECHSRFLNRETLPCGNSGVNSHLLAGQFKIGLNAPAVGGISVSSWVLPTPTRPGRSEKQIESLRPAFLSEFMREVADCRPTSC